MISILILTHNRPKLFRRCLLSVLNQLPKDCEIIVNNDSNDIVEIKDYRIKYFYNNYETISDIYKFLFNQSSKKYIYFLEDDDYLLKDFFLKVKLNYDLYYMNYIPAYASDIQYNFKVELKNDLFQLSQLLIKKSLLTVNDIPSGNYRDNDWILFQKIMLKKPTIKLLKYPVYKQTVDGNDNISFGENKWPLN